MLRAVSGYFEVKSGVGVENDTTLVKKSLIRAILEDYSLVQKASILVVFFGLFFLVKKLLFF